MELELQAVWATQHGCQYLNWSSPEEQQVFFNGEPSLQPIVICAYSSRAVKAEKGISGFCWPPSLAEWVSPMPHGSARDPMLETKVESRRDKHSVFICCLHRHVHKLNHTSVHMHLHTHTYKICLYKTRGYWVNTDTKSTNGLTLRKVRRYHLCLNTINIRTC